MDTTLCYIMRKYCKNMVMTSLMTKLSFARGRLSSVHAMTLILERTPGIAQFVHNTPCLATTSGMAAVDKISRISATIYEER